MYAEPSDLDGDDIVSALRDRWGLVVSTLAYEPVGFGSHHYVATEDGGRRWFVTVDPLDDQSWLAADDIDSALDALDRAFATTVILRRAGLEFVLAPIESDGGGATERLGDRYAISVCPFVDGTSNEDGAFASVEERRWALGSLGRLHAATPRVPDGLPRGDTLEVPDRRHLERALEELDSPWTGGPYAERPRLLLGSGARGARQLLDRYDELARMVSPTTASWVVTHGEPHGANLMRTAEGRRLLIDWGTVAVAPRERDLWMVCDPHDADDWAAYTKHAPSPPVDPAALELYRHWWSLAEIAGYTRTFRSQHGDDANTRAAWANLQEYIRSDVRPGAGPTSSDV